MDTLNKPKAEVSCICYIHAMTYALLLRFPFKFPSSATEANEYNPPLYPRTDLKMSKHLSHFGDFGHLDHLGHSVRLL